MNRNWQNIGFNPLRFTPAVGFAAAAKSFAGINRSIADEKAVESLATFRERKQDFAEGAPGREIAKEGRLRKESANRAVFANNAVEEINAQAQSDFFNNPEVAEQIAAHEGYNRAVNGSETGPADPTKVQEFRDRFGQDNRGRILRSNEFQNLLSQKLLSSGQFGSDESAITTSGKVNSQYATLSLEERKLLSGNNRSFGGGNGGGNPSKALLDINSPEGRAAIEDRLVSSRGLDKTPDTLLGFRLNFPGTNTDPGGSDISKVLGKLSADGFSGPVAEATLAQAFDDDGDTLKDDLDFTTPEGYAALRDLATKNRNSGSVFGGSSAAQLQANSFARDDQILARGTTQNYSDDELVAQFLSAFDSPAAAVKQTQVFTPEVQAAPEEALQRPVFGAENEPNANGVFQGNPLNEGLLPELTGGFGDFTGSEVKDMNGSLRKMRLYAIYPDTTSLPSMTELRTAAKHPGVSPQELISIESLLGKIKSKNTNKRGRRT